jgi:malate dehydrogenase (oxaloacetate-decarboxylating)(NADP+)
MCFIGLSVKGRGDPGLVKSMAPKPIIFAMANPDPEITPEEVKAVRADAIVATGRSDYANQVNNVLGFPYIFPRRARRACATINDQMKIAAAEALAALARQDVPDEVDAAYSGRRLRFGPEYIIPVPFDPRLISACRRRSPRRRWTAASRAGPIIDMEDYKATLAARLDPAAASMHLIFERLHLNPRAWCSPRARRSG